MPATQQHQRHGHAAPIAAFSSLGVVFGDLGTSPLYTVQTVVQSAGGKFAPASAMGMLSLIFWTLIVIVTVKYCIFVMRADNEGEGGILALMSLVGANALKGAAGVLAAMGLIGAALIYGDGVITPAISVLSALEGVNVATSALKPYVLPTAVVILIGLFAVQRFGTSKIGAAFGPVMLVWFLVIAALGIGGIVRHPGVLAAVNPVYALSFLLHGGPTTLLVLGSVFLCVTGGEALYADMGHFGRGPIRGAWFIVVLPALLLSYAGQTALLIDKGAGQGNPFYELAPHWAVYPLVILATLATIIASQAIITGAFSMTRQAVQLGWLPSMSIRQTSSRSYGQIFVPVVNRLMMVATIAIAIAFGSSDKLAGAYGTAVSTTMLLTTCLLFEAMRKVWKWPLALVIPLAGLFVAVDFSFFVANLLKIVQGGWVPLAFGALLFTIMVTWRSGVDAVRAILADRSEPVDQFMAELREQKIIRVPGVGVFLSRGNEQVPPAVIDHARYTRSLYKNVIMLNVSFEETPRVDDKDRTTIEHVEEGMWRAHVRFGFIESPDLKAALSRIDGLDPSVDFDQAIYISARDLVIGRAQRPRMPRWQAPIFGFLYRNAVRVVDRFNLPPNQVVEVSREVRV